MAELVGGRMLMTDGGSEIPPPPDGLPQYVQDPIKRQSPDRLREIAVWAEQLADHYESGEIEVDEDEEVVSKRETSSKYTIVEKLQTCGDETCACMKSGGRGDLHGPYIYKVEYVGGGKQKWTYYGPVNR